jgi:hypothetical protein
MNDPAEEKFEMKIEFSRHAKRRAKLYNIPKSTIEKLLLGSDLADGEYELIRDIPGFKYPVKIVFSVEIERNSITVNQLSLKERKNP